MTLTSDDCPYLPPVEPPGVCLVTLPSPPGKGRTSACSSRKPTLISLAKAAPTALRPFTRWPCGDRPLPWVVSSPEPGPELCSRPVLGPYVAVLLSVAPVVKFWNLLSLRARRVLTNTAAPTPLPSLALSCARLPVYHSETLTLCPEMGGTGVGCWSGLAPTCMLPSSHIKPCLLSLESVPSRGPQGSLRVLPAESQHHPPLEVSSHDFSLL